MSVKIEILDYVYDDVNIIDWDKSVVGELDITDHTDFPLAVTFQISDFKNLTSNSGDYSKSFKIPATKNNNNILKQIYTPNLVLSNNVTAKKSCRILFNNLYTLVGLLQIDGVGGYGETPSYYNCVFFGSNLRWSNELDNSYMNTIEWGGNGENLTYNKPSITNTWEYDNCENSANSPIVYPITSYGDYNPNGTPRTIQLLSTLGEHNAALDPLVYKGYYGFYNTGTSYGTPIPVPDWRPAVFVKTTLKKIFKGINYTINSAFMETDMFKKLVWLLPNFKYNEPAERVLEYSVRSSFTNGVTMTDSEGNFPTETDIGVQKFFNNSVSQGEGDYFWDGDGTQVLDMQASNLDVTLNSAFVDMTNNYVTIQEYGNYRLNLNGLESRVARAYKGGNNEYMIYYIETRIMIEVQTVGQQSWNILEELGNNALDIFQDVDNNTDANTEYVDIKSIDITRFLNKGDRIRLSLGIRLFSPNTNQNYAVSIFYKAKTNSVFNIELDPFNVEYGQTYNLKDVINYNDKQIDFVKGVAHAFNLKMTTNESTRTVNIEPFNSFYKPYSEAIDWSYKLDRSNITSDKFAVSNLKRDLIFKYKTDSADKRVESRSYLFDDIKDEYPYKEELPDTFEKGTTKFENPFFAGTYNAKDQDTTHNNDNSILDNPFSACLWIENSFPDDIGRPNKGYDFLPRLLYWNKYTSAAPIIGNSKRAVVQTWNATLNHIIAGSTNLQGALYLNYPQATMLNRDSVTSPNLAYGNAVIRNYDDITGIYAPPVIVKGLYETYYQNMIEALKRSPRVRAVSIDLKSSDIINLDFKKLIYIDGVYWRLNRIVDFKPNKNESTKVELIEWFQFGSFAASAPMFGQSGTENWNNNGSSTDNSNDNMGL